MSIEAPVGAFTYHLSGPGFNATPTNGPEPRENPAGSDLPFGSPRQVGGELVATPRPG
jgi:hypothetical protein